MRILFVSEDVTLAQVVRLVVLARSLKPSQHEIHFACRYFDELVFKPNEFNRHTIHTVDREVVHKALARGKRLYDKRTLRKYIRQEIALIEAIKPDLIVGDFRLSLSVSAAACGVSLATLINAYWSPHAVRDSFPLPDHPIINVVGEEMATRYFPIAIPKVFEHFARPINALRKEFGLTKLGSLLEVLTHGDHTLYPDVPALAPIEDLPDSHRYIGPVLWSPDVPLPRWWSQWSENSANGREARPRVYVTMGSSGNVSALSVVLEALAELPVSVAVATAGRTDLGSLPETVQAAEFVPGHLASERASLVISNGGSTTGYQALRAATPVLGIASNLDQHLAMTAIEERGAGIRLRAQGLRADAVRASVRAILDTDDYFESARRVAEEFERWDSAAIFSRFIASMVHPDPSRRDDTKLPRQAGGPSYQRVSETVS
ncbi:MAG: glycosyltransferase [Proteobacteria bacterium]|nr:glycosyltransferase [Pseudomonadota bacterium]